MTLKQAHKKAEKLLGSNVTLKQTEVKTFRSNGGFEKSRVFQIFSWTAQVNVISHKSWADCFSLVRKALK